MSKRALSTWLVVLTACTVTHGGSAQTMPQEKPCTTIATCSAALDRAHDRFTACPSCPGRRAQYDEAQRTLESVTRRQNATANAEARQYGGGTMANLRAREAERQRVVAEQVEARRQAAQEREQRRLEHEAEDQRARDEARAKEDARQEELEQDAKDPKYGVLVLSNAICGQERDLANLRKRFTEMKRINQQSGTIRPEEQRELVESIDDMEKKLKRYKTTIRTRFKQDGKACNGGWQKNLDACLQQGATDDANAPLCNEPYATAAELIRGDFDYNLVSEQQ